jgi:hypothetical protein
MEYCDHELDPQTMICVNCGLTAEAIAGGRDRPPTWEDVDEAYNDAYRLGIEIGMASYKYKRRKKLIEVGYYLCLRRLGQSVDKGKGDEA